MNSIKFCADIRKTSLPFVTVSEGTFKDFCFLLDTGSNENILFKPTYQYVKSQMYLTNLQSSVSGIGGGESSVPIAQASISFCGVEHKTSFLLLDANDTVKGIASGLGVQMAGIIGIKFMLAHRWIIDIVAQEVRIRPMLILDCA